MGKDRKKYGQKEDVVALITKTQSGWILAIGARPLEWQRLCVG